MIKRPLPAGLALGLVLSAFSAALPAAPVSAPRPALWAAAVSGTRVENLYRIERDLFRSAQPTSGGFSDLAALGVKSVLRVSGGDGDRQDARETGLKLFHIPMSAFGLRDGRVLEALRIMADPGNRPLVIHCQHGADRTGALVALYRVVVQGWSKADAIREMDEGGFHHSSFWRNLDRYVLEADVEAMRRKLGIPAPTLPSERQASATEASTAAPAAAVNH